MHFWWQLCNAACILTDKNRRKTTIWHKSSQIFGWRLPQGFILNNWMWVKTVHTTILKYQVTKTWRIKKTMTKTELTVHKESNLACESYPPPPPPLFCTDARTLPSYIYNIYATLRWFLQTLLYPSGHITTNLCSMNEWVRTVFSNKAQTNTLLLVSALCCINQ